MATKIDLPLEIVARNAFYQDPRRRAWALVAYMVEHEELRSEPVGTEQDQERAREAPRVFRAAELHRGVLPPKAGYGGYCHPWAAGMGRTNVIRALAGAAELEGWITRERARYGGVYSFTLTETGRDIYRSKIKPHWDAFVAEFMTTATHPSSLRPALVQAERMTGKIDASREKGIAAPQKKYESAQLTKERHSARHGRASVGVIARLSRTENRDRSRAESFLRRSCGQ